MTSEYLFEVEGGSVPAARDLTPEVPPEKLKDDEIYDYISGTDVVKLTPVEEVRQRVAEALVHSYHINPADMERDFPIKVTNQETGRVGTKKASIAIFESGKPHTLEYLRRIVVTKPKPRVTRTVTKVRTYAQASKDLQELKDLMIAAGGQCELGLWTDDIDMYFLRHISKRFEEDFKQLPNWPISDLTFDAARDTTALAELRRADKYMLRFAFRRCHNYIHGNEGMPKDAAFWQFLYVLFAKMYDERLMNQDRRGYEPRFRVDVDDLQNDAGAAAVAERVKMLFFEVKDFYKTKELFKDRDEITLSDKALAFIAGELAPYSLSSTDIDAKGVAYQELVGTNLRGDRGQYFTPGDAVRLVVDILDPQESETVLDPCCGTGGFLRETLNHLLDRWKAEEGTRGRPDSRQDLARHRARLAEFAQERLFGTDFDPFLVRATQMSIMMLTDTVGNVFQLDSLAFPEGHLPGVSEANDRIPLGRKVDVLMTNPPFGSDIPVTDEAILRKFRGRTHSVGLTWSRPRGSTELVSGAPATNVSPEKLFVERAVQWVKPGGRIGIVLPNGILSNPGPEDEAVRRFILDECWVMASIELPVETFIVEANVNILTTLLFLRKKTQPEKTIEANRKEALDYPVFMAVAEKVGVDRRGNPLYARTADGEIITEETSHVETLVIRGQPVERTIRRFHPKIDNDLDPKVIAAKYHDFVKQYRDELPWNL